MVAYCVHRLLAVIPTLLVVTLVTFSMVLLTGDPATAMLGPEATPEAVRALRKELGLNRPIVVQYLNWLTAALSGNLGRSIRSTQPVSQAILERLPVTIELTCLALLFSLVIGLPIGVLSATRRGSKSDVMGSIFAMFGVAMPSFWLGIMLILFFSLYLRWLPPSGYADPLKDPVGNLRLIIMPAVTLGWAQAAIVMRQTRSSVLEVLGEAYVVTARAKGLRERVVLERHVLKNALIPVITVVGLQVGRLLGGAVVVETVFALPGIGRLAVDSIFTRDFPMVQGVVLVATVAVLSSSFVVDLIYAYIDPRIRYA